MSHVTLASWGKPAGANRTHGTKSWVEGQITLTGKNHRHRENCFMG